jgi:hypothetical protein
MFSARDYWTALAIEAAASGLLVVPVAKISQRWFPNNPLLQLFVAGAACHLIAEATGVNGWYITHGAAARYDWECFYSSAKTSPRDSSKQCQLVSKSSRQPLLWVARG